MREAPAVQEAPTVQEAPAVQEASVVREVRAVPMAPPILSGRALLLGAAEKSARTCRNARPEPAQPVLSDRRFCPVPESAPDAQYPHPPVRSQAEAPVRFPSCRYAHSASPDAWAEAARQYPRTGPALLPFSAGLSASVRSLPPPFRLCSPNILLYHVSGCLSIGFWKKQSAPDPLILCGPEAEHMYEVRSVNQRCTLPLALPFASDSTSLAESGLLSPSTECFRQLAAAAKDTASCVEKPSRSA